MTDVTKEQILELINEIDSYDSEIRFNVDGYDVKIAIDEFSENPREDWDNFGKMICFHKRYNLGDKHDYSNHYQFIHAESGLYPYEDTKFLSDEQFEECEEAFENNNVVLPLYLYDHSGITMSTTPFSCPWDSGQVGFIYVPKDEVCKVYGVDEVTDELYEKVCDVFRSEVSVYDAYLRGEVYCFSVEKDGEHVNSCCGFYGDIEENGILDEIVNTINYDIENAVEVV